MTAGIGHNSGRVFEPGQSWRKHVWTRARRDLMPKLPIEVIRLRVTRAAELGLPYKTYAGVRASTGHDLVGFLFSSNALGVIRPGQAVPEKLKTLVRTDRVALAHGAVILSHLSTAPTLDAAYLAPDLTHSWSATRDHLCRVMRRHGALADRYLMIGDTALERDWAGALRTAGYLPAADFFENLDQPTPSQ